MLFTFSCFVWVYVVVAGGCVYCWFVVGLICVALLFWFIGFAFQFCFVSYSWLFVIVAVLLLPGLCFDVFVCLICFFGCWLWVFVISVLCHVCFWFYFVSVVSFAGVLVVFGLLFVFGGFVFCGLALLILFRWLVLAFYVKCLRLCWSWFTSVRLVWMLLGDFDILF